MILRRHYLQDLSWRLVLLRVSFRATTAITKCTGQDLQEKHPDDPMSNRELTESMGDHYKTRVIL